MADLRDLPDIGNTINTLNQQIEDGRQKLVSAREEATDLREKNIALIDRVERRDCTIEHLEGQLVELRQEVRQLRTAAWRDDAATLEDAKLLETTEMNEPQPRKTPTAPGFSVLPTDHEHYKDLWDNTGRKDNGVVLKEFVASLNKTNVKPEILREHLWMLDEAVPAKPEFVESRNDEENVMRVETENKRSTNVIPEHLQLSGKPDEKKAERVPQDIPVSDAMNLLHMAPTSPARRNYFHPADPRRDSLKDSIFGKYATGKKRSLPEAFDRNQGTRRARSVCVHCWATDSFCDNNGRMYGQCGTCRSDNVKCVHKLCDGGLGCRNPRCPCLHPGDWDPNNPEWIVEEGKMPQKGRRRSGPDFYRPGEGRRAR